MSTPSSEPIIGGEPAPTRRQFATRDPLPATIPLATRDPMPPPKPDRTREQLVATRAAVSSETGPYEDIRPDLLEWPSRAPVSTLGFPRARYTSPHLNPHAAGLPPASSDVPEEPEGPSVPQLPSRDQPSVAPLRIQQVSAESQFPIETQASSATITPNRKTQSEFYE